MTTYEFSILDALHSFGPQTPGEVAEGGPATSHQNAYQNLLRLERRGFVARGEQGIWHLTDKARLVLAL